MSDARMALQAARASGAQRQAAPWYSSAQLLIDSAERSLGRHEFRAARTRAVLAKDMAITARTIALAIAHAKAAYARALARGKAPAGVPRLIADAERSAAGGDEATALALATRATELSEAGAKGGAPPPQNE